MHKTDKSRMFFVLLASAPTSQNPFPTMRDKHITTHVDVYCDDCDKRFSAKRNLRRHIKKKHEIQDDTLSDMVDRAELVIQN